MKRTLLQDFIYFISHVEQLRLSKILTVARASAHLYAMKDAT